MRWMLFQHPIAHVSGFVIITKNADVADASAPMMRWRIWREVEPDIRQKRWQELPASLADHGISTMRLPLSQEAILQLADARLHDGGTWMLGGREYAIKASKPLDTLTATNTDQSAVINLAR
jgi:hypothetical protein